MLSSPAVREQIFENVMEKIGRNDPCPCGSGKKFKKCCESKMIGGRFMATRVEPSHSSGLLKGGSLSSFFQSHVAQKSEAPSSRTIEAQRGPVSKKEHPSDLNQGEESNGPVEPPQDR